MFHAPALIMIQTRGGYEPFHTERLDIGKSFRFAFR